MGINSTQFTDRYNFFWENLISDSQHLEEPVHYQQAFKDPVLTLEEIKSVFIGMSNDTSKNKKSFIRVYINGLQSAEYEQIISNTSPKLSESLEQWTHNIFKEKQFCIIVNYANQWSEILSIKTGHFINPLLKTFPIPQISISTTIILGNYIHTPFGIHIDQPHYRSLHLHLGPGKKKFLLWDKDSFQSLTGSDKNNYKPEKISNPKHSFDISPGDTFLIPAKYYHVGRNEKFSVALGITLTKNIKENVLLEACRNSFKDLSIHIKEHDIESPLFSRITQYQNIASEIPIGDSFENWINQSINNYIYMKKSNLGFRHPPLKSSILLTHLSQLKRKKIQLCYPYKIYFYNQNDKIHIFVRHNHFTMKSMPIIQTLIEKINGNEIIRISTLLQEFSNFLAEDTILGILILFIRLRGIAIIT